MLTRKELQEKLGELEESGEVEDINRNAKTSELQAVYQDYLDKQKPEPGIAPVVINCPVCGGEVEIIDNWLTCGNCHHKKYVA